MAQEWIEAEFWKHYLAWSSQDRETLVQPLQSCLRNDGTDFPPVFYGEWHQTKLFGSFDTHTHMFFGNSVWLVRHTDDA